MPVFAKVLLCVAGVLFLILSVYDGFSALASHGIDVRLTDEASGQILLGAGVTWLIGLVSAVLGPLAWATRRLSRSLVLFLAVVDAAAMMALIGVASAVFGAPAVCALSPTLVSAGVMYQDIGDSSASRHR